MRAGHRAVERILKSYQNLMSEERRLQQQSIFGESVQLASENENYGPVEPECRELSENGAGESCSLPATIRLFESAAGYSNSSVKICLNFGGSPKSPGLV